MSWLLHTVVGGGLLLLLARALAARTVQPARRQRLAEWAVAAALVLALLSLAPAWLVVTLPAPAPPPPAAPARTEAPPVVVAPAPVALPVVLPEAVPAAPADPAPAAPAVREKAVRPAPAPPAAPVVPAGRAVEETPRPWLDRERLTFILLAAYGAASAVLLGRWLLGCAALGYLLGGAVSVGGSAGRQLGIMTLTWRRRPRLLVAPRVRVPFSFGLWRPTVVLPSALARDGDPAVLRWVLAHELTHLRRRDARSAVLLGLGQLVYFYLPWFWWLHRQVRLCQEYVADAAAADEGRPEDYAEFLVGWTAAPALPAGAAGVSGHSSDLYRRITMLLQSPVRVEPRCPRRWSLAAAVALLGLAVLGAGLGLRAYAAPAPAKGPKEPAKDAEPGKAVPKDDKAPKKPEAPAAPGFPDVDDFLKRLPPGMDKAQIDLMRKQFEMMRKQMDAVRRMAPGGFRPPVVNPFGGGIGLGGVGGIGGFPGMPGMPGMAGSFAEPRLGAQLQAPSATLVDQLDLPRDQGMVLQRVPAGSAAAKAGLKAHDVLLELNGKPVPSKVPELRKLLEGVKPDTKVEAVVLRKGKKETIKNLSLPEAKRVPGFGPGFNPPGGGFPGFPRVPALRLPPAVAPPAGLMPPGLGAGRGVMTTLFYTADGFTTRHQEGSLIITVTGKVDDGKPKVSEIQVQDGAASNRYTSVDKVPERYRAKVKNLVGMAEKNKVHVEVKEP